jgi:isochorismate synthase
MMNREELCEHAARRANATNTTTPVSWHVGDVERDLRELRRSIGHGCGRAFFWSSPNSKRHILALGVAHELPAGGDGDRWLGMRAAWARLAAGCTAHDASPLLVGGGSYSAAREAAMPPVAFWVPELQYEAYDGGAVRLTVNGVCRPGDTAAEISARLGGAVARAHARPAVPSQPVGPLARFEQVPAFPAWSRRIEDILREIESGHLEKVVLARAFEVEVDGRFDIGRALDDLDARQAGSIVFAVGWDQTAFIGATPELLVAIDGLRLQTIALAGSAPRSADPGEDERLGKQLRESAKDQHEHAFVAEYITTALSRLGMEVTSDPEPRLIRHPGIQHLGTRIEGKLPKQDAAFVFDVIDALHPTPAVGGVPRQAAIEWQRDHEGIDRGWYAAPLGWLDVHGNSEIAVGIRSALVRPQRATIYAGCGIVHGSNPRAEYEESWIKAERMLTALLPPEAVFGRV